uniref:Uncharacterized protein n=1 Tax=Aegilops tauschii subsp. strangulata TaxID=200361 RepID=A0A453T385_AEGTS
MNLELLCFFALSGTILDLEQLLFLQIISAFNPLANRVYGNCGTRRHPIVKTSATTSSPHCPHDSSNAYQAEVFTIAGKIIHLLCTYTTVNGR